MHTIDLPAEPPEPPLGPPPFSFHEDTDFVADMVALVPSDRIRDEICAHLQSIVNRILAGLDAPGHVTLSGSIGGQLLVTDAIGVAPALRVVFSIVDEYPKRHINFRAAALRDQSSRR
jgi:hypothetical protein